MEKMKKMKLDEEDQQFIAQEVENRTSVDEIEDFVLEPSNPNSLPSCSDTSETISIFVWRKNSNAPHIFHEIYVKLHEAHRVEGSLLSCFEYRQHIARGLINHFTCKQRSRLTLVSSEKVRNQWTSKYFQKNSTYRKSTMTSNVQRAIAENRAQGGDIYQLDLKFFTLALRESEAGDVRRLSPTRGTSGTNSLICSQRSLFVFILFTNVPAPRQTSLEPIKRDPADKAKKEEKKSSATHPAVVRAPKKAFQGLKFTAAGPRRLLNRGRARRSQCAPASARVKLLDFSAPNQFSNRHLLLPPQPPTRPAPPPRRSPPHLLLQMS
ncbi:hypothetical protein EVAR_41778_1 [Eumeta japonica]|uniref:Uncharacterized protein n=1 Tax=Eumeta variegata TaxID=151549 RepID=A0A4C1VYM6_EUMVA|nr:hypothetical protein EVAR_41778_1 [Eumeta japonica]